MSLPVTTDFRGEMILLGTGTSVGVPTIGCGCAVCRSAESKNKRTRCSAILGLPQGNLLIDTSPDLRLQLLREDIGLVHAVAFTHEHADHIFGLDDLRIFQFYLGSPVPLYCEANVERRIRHSFDYAFSDVAHTHAGAAPQLTFRQITPTKPVELLGESVLPLRLKHGPRFDVLGFRLGNVAYCTDTNGIPDETRSHLEGLDVLVLDALRDSPHPTHFSLEQAVELARQLRPKQALFTHIAHQLDHAETNSRLPTGMALAFDGQRVRLT